MEVLSGVLRRRNWSAAVKERIVSETLEPGVTVTEVARRHEVDRSLVYRWRRELGVTRLADPAKLLAVEVAEDAPAADPLPGEAQAADELSGDGGRIEIELPSGIRVRVIPPVDAMALAHALGRKNYLFAGSDAGGKRAAAIYSLIETATRRARLRFSTSKDAPPPQFPAILGLRLASGESLLPRISWRELT
jgi:transposase